jgi:predicted RNA-binding Zn ribbon-like protein
MPRNAYSVLVEGKALPAPIGGHPALDFCNTLAGWDEEEPGDYLGAYDHLVLWAAGWELIDDGTAAELRALGRDHPGEADQILGSARELRAALYHVLTERESGAALDLVGAVARRAYESSELDLDGGRARWRLSPSAGLPIPLYAVARAGAELLTSGEASAVHRCPGNECGWLFIDRSGRRRWCTMAICGNRAKARRFAERQRGSRVSRTGPGR